MPYFIITLGNGYQYQLFAATQAEALQQAKSQAPSGVSVGGTDLATATANSVGDTPLQGVRDANGNYPGGPGFGGADDAGSGVSSGSGADATAGGGGGGGGTGSGGTTFGLENINQKAAYQRGLQRQGMNPEGLFASYLDELYGSVFPTFGIETAIAGGPPEGADLDNLFQDFTARTPVSSFRERATNAFRDLFDPKSRELAGRDPKGAALLAGYDDPFGTAGGQYNDDRINELSALARQAAGSKWSPILARNFLPSNKAVQNRFARGGYQGSFLDELKRAFGLTGGF